MICLGINIVLRYLGNVPKLSDMLRSGLMKFEIFEVFLKSGFK